LSVVNTVVANCANIESIDYALEFFSLDDLLGPVQNGLVTTSRTEIAMNHTTAIDRSAPKLYSGPSSELQATKG